MCIPFHKSTSKSIRGSIVDGSERLVYGLGGNCKSDYFESTLMSESVVNVDVLSRQTNNARGSNRV